MTNVPKVMTTEEREKIKERCEKMIDLFVKKEIDFINLKEVGGKFPQPLFMDKVHPFIIIEAEMELEYIVNGYSSSGRKPMNQDPDVQEGFYIFGIKFTCPNCKEWMQPIQNDIILSWEIDQIDNISITVKPDPICPHCRYEFEFSKSKTTIGEYRARKKVEGKNEKEIKKVDGSYSWP